MELAVVLILFLALLLLGMNIASVLLISGLIGIYLIGGANTLVNMLQTDIFTRISSYTFTTVPLFILMAQFVIQSGIVKDMYTIVYNYSRGKSEVLGGLTIVLGSVLGAVSGSGTATAAALGSVSVPELTKHGYKPELAGAIASVSGSLSGIIPPSIILILYGAVTQTAVNKLFVGAIVPGVIITLIFIASTLMVYRMQLKHRPLDAKLHFEKKYIPAKKYVVTIVTSLAILFIIFIGIYAGIFTPTEAGAVGAFVGFVAVAVLGKVNLTFIRKSAIETLKVTGMVMMIMIGAQLFSRFITLSLLPKKIIAMLGPILDVPILIILILILIYTVLFMLLEGAAVIVMTVPLTLPITMAAGIDALWFGVVIGMICTIGLLTPPVGLAVFAVSGATNVSLASIFRLTLPISIITTLIIGVLVIVFPELITWLPSTMSK